MMAQTGLSEVEYFNLCAGVVAVQAAVRRPPGPRSGSFPTAGL